MRRGMMQLAARALSGAVALHAAESSSVLLRASACSTAAAAAQLPRSFLTPATTAATAAFHGSAMAAAPEAQPPPVESNPMMASPLQAAPAPVTGTRKDAVAKAVKKNLQISQKKLNEVARLVRRMHIDDALAQTQVLPKKAARIVHALLLEARANAVTQHGMDPGNVYVDEAWVGKGEYTKRVWPHAMMKSGVRRSYIAHLTVTLREPPFTLPKKLRVVQVDAQGRKIPRTPVTDVDDADKDLD